MKRTMTMTETLGILTNDCEDILCEYYPICDINDSGVEYPNCNDCDLIKNILGQ